MGWFSKMLGFDDVDEAFNNYTASVAAEQARQEEERKRQAELKANADTVAASRQGKASNILSGNGGKGIGSPMSTNKPSQVLAGGAALAGQPLPGAALAQEEDEPKKLRMR